MKILKYLSLFCLLIACSPKVEKKIEVSDPATGQSTEVKISKDIFGKETTIETKDGSASVNLTEGKLPSGLPDFIKAYPNAKEIQSVQANEIKDKNDGNKGDALMVNFKTLDAPDKVLEYYKKQLQDNGFKEHGNMKLGPMVMASFANEDKKMAVQIIATLEDGKSETNAQLIFEKEKAK